MKKSTLKTWQGLQDRKYFDWHRCYQGYPFGQPQHLISSDIIGKKLVEIGCGYGRETLHFSTYCDKVYAIDVTQDILDKNKQIIKEQQGKSYLDNVTYILAEGYKDKLPNTIDFAYTTRVFQHLAPEQVKEYIDIIFSKMVKGGIFHAQFYEGTDRFMDEDQEPRVQFTIEEILELFKDYKVSQIITEENFVSSKTKIDFKHIYITAEKE